VISSSEILRILHSEKNRLRRAGITDIGLFGSYLRGETTEKSDIDILIDLSDDTLFSD
jgi:predicted nucleotidyltransferase